MIKHKHKQMLESGLCYESRNHFLKLLGFKTYPEYLRSQLWLEIKGKVLRSRGNKCSICPKAAEEIHHTRYHSVDLKGEALEHLWPICRKCHTEIEFEGVQKLDLKRANVKFYAAIHLPYPGVPPKPLRPSGQTRKPKKPKKIRIPRSEWEELRNEIKTLKSEITDLRFLIEHSHRRLAGLIKQLGHEISADIL